MYIWLLLHYCVLVKVPKTKLHIHKTRQRPIPSILITKFHKNLDSTLFISEAVAHNTGILFRIYLKSLKYFLKIFTTFIPENFPEICINFSKNFLKNLIKISIKFYLRTAQILPIVYSKFPENFHHLVDIPGISITISSHLNIFTIN